MDSNLEQQLQFLIEGKNFDGAFKLVLSGYQQKVYWHVRRMLVVHEDANDVVQDVFIKVWKALPNFQGQSKVYTWLYRIATNECITFLQKKRMTMVEDGDEYLSHVQSDHHALELTGDEIKNKLMKAVYCLPEKQQLVFNMKYFDHMKYEEMSDVLGTSVGALKASYHHAVKKIEEILKED